MIAFVCLAVPAAAFGRTWRVNPAGTGDAPTLYAAMDSSAAGDTVLVAPGAHYLMEDRLLVPSGVQVVAELDAAVTVVHTDPGDPGGISLRGGAGLIGIHVKGANQFVLFLNGSNLVRGCIVEGGQPWTVYVEGGGCQLSGNLFLDYLVTVEGGSAFFDRNIILSTLDAYLPEPGNWQFSFNDVLGSVDPVFDTLITPAYYNFSADPLFCGIAGSENYFLRSDSPCLPENNPYDLPVMAGPLPMGCGSVRTEMKTWGAVKALYR
jgi:hypothetical protein